MTSPRRTSEVDGCGWMRQRRRPAPPRRHEPPLLHVESPGVPPGPRPCLQDQTRPNPLGAHPPRGAAVAEPAPPSSLRTRLPPPLARLGSAAARSVATAQPSPTASTGDVDPSGDALVPGDRPSRLVAEIARTARSEVRDRPGPVVTPDTTSRAASPCAAPSGADLFYRYARSTSAIPSLQRAGDRAPADRVAPTRGCPVPVVRRHRRAGMGGQPCVRRLPHRRRDGATAPRLLSLQRRHRLRRRPAQRDGHAARRHALAQRRDGGEDEGRRDPGRVQRTVPLQPPPTTAPVPRRDTQVTQWDDHECQQLVSRELLTDARYPRTRRRALRAGRRAFHEYIPERRSRPTPTDGCTRPAPRPPDRLFVPTCVRTGHNTADKETLRDGGGSARSRHAADHELERSVPLEGDRRRPPVGLVVRTDGAGSIARATRSTAGARARHRSRPHRTEACRHPQPRVADGRRPYPPRPLLARPARTRTRPVLGVRLGSANAGRSARTRSTRPSGHVRSSWRHHHGEYVTRRGVPVLRGVEVDGYTLP